MKLSNINDTNYIKLSYSVKNNEKETKLSNDNKTSEINLNNNLLSLLNKSTISFSGMKKSQFSGIDLIMINKLTKENGFNIQSKDINSNDDFQQYCQNILNEEYLGSDNIKKLSDSFDSQAQMQKEKIITDWCDYVSKENDAYNPAIQLMILSSITKNLDKNTNHLPPILDKRKVADTIEEIIEKSKTIKNYEPNFDKLYRFNLQKNILKTETQLDSSLNGWIIIPSKENDPENFKENVKKLQTLSYDTWCTKTYNAQPYLTKGDFHIYMENGKPKLGVRFDKDIIQEIQGEKNDTNIPLSYLDIAKSHVEENGYKINESTQNEFKRVNKLSKKIAQIKSELGEDVFKNKEYDKILPYFGIEVTKDDDGLITLNHYIQPEYARLSDLIDEDDLFKYVKEIKGNADFYNSQITSLGILKYIGGDADFRRSKLTSLGNLEYIGGGLDCNCSANITSLGNLKYIGGKADFEYSKLTSLNNLEYIGGNADFSNSNIISLGKLKTINGNVDFYQTKLTSLNNLEYIGGNVDFRKSGITSLDNIGYVGGKINYSDAQIEEIKNKIKDIAPKETYSMEDVIKILKAMHIAFDINEDATFNVAYYNSSLMQQLGINEDEIFKYIVDIKGDAHFENTKLKSLGKLEHIGGDASFINSSLTSLGNLRFIDGNAVFTACKITSLGNLKRIGKSAKFNSVLFTSLDNLEYIGEDVRFIASNISSFGKLKYIGGCVNYRLSEITSIPEDLIIKGKIYN